MGSKSILLFLLLALSCISCATPSHPCLQGGEPARETPFIGDKQCTQKKNKDGAYVNEGLYREWYPNGKLALEGFYKDGHKDGVWVEYSSIDGRKISEHYFEDGVEKLRPPSKSN
jgi:antitoxin component YwqK of YwqJK toxin-antitoxin module